MDEEDELLSADEFLEAIEEPFAVPDLSVMWDDILQRYKTMGFSFPLTDAEKGTSFTDNEMIAELTWVHQQYRKFIGKKRTDLIELAENMDSMLATLKDMIAKDSIVPEDRRTLVYQAMKHQWLEDTWNHMAWVYEHMRTGEGEYE